MRGATNKHYMLALLAIILAFNAVDRLAMGLVLQDIKVDLSLSDSQLGFLTGIAFALFYSVMGIPLAFWADRGNRVTIVSVTTALWSAAVALCGLAGNFVQLMLVRVGVAVGEAGCIPPAHSLIADHFTRAERPKATARYLLGVPLSALIGYFLAGWLNQFYGWRITFVILGVPGLVLAALAALTLTEPRRSNPDLAFTPASSSSARPSLREVCVALWSNVTFRHLAASYAVASFFNTGIAQWKPAFFMRSHGLETGVLGTWLALIYGVGNVAGIYAGGELASRFAANNERLQLRAMAVLWSAFGLISIGIYLSSSHYVAFGLAGVAAVGGAATGGPIFATIQTLIPAHMRASSIAVLLLFSNLVGLGLGPLAVGTLSDALRPHLGEESLRYALLFLCPGYVWASWHLWRAGRTVNRDLEPAYCQ